MMNCDDIRNRRDEIVDEAERIMKELEVMDVDSHAPDHPIGRNGRDAYHQAYAARSWAEDAALKCLERWLKDAEERLTIAKNYLTAAKEAQQQGSAT